MWDSHNSRHSGPIRSTDQPADPPVGVLLVSASARDHNQLAQTMCGSVWQFHSCATAEEARALLGSRSFSVVICSDSVTSWRELLDAVAQLGADGPKFVLATSVLNGSLWAEALSRGAFDVLVQPFDTGEVLHVVQNGWSALQRARRKPQARASDLLA